MKATTMIDKRDAEIKKAFIKYLEQNTDERFFQALTNFCQVPYLGYAITPRGEQFRDLWHMEADKDINWIGKTIDKK